MNCATTLAFETIDTTNHNAKATLETYRKKVEELEGKITEENLKCVDENFEKIVKLCMDIPGEVANFINTQHINLGYEADKFLNKIHTEMEIVSDLVTQFKSCSNDNCYLYVSTEVEKERKELEMGKLERLVEDFDVYVQEFEKKIGDYSFSVAMTIYVTCNDIYDDIKNCVNGK